MHCGSTGTLTPALLAVELLVARTGLSVGAEALAELLVKYLPWRTPFGSGWALTLTGVKVKLLGSVALWGRFGTLALAGFLVQSSVGGAEWVLGTPTLAGAPIEHLQRGAGAGGARGTAALAEDGVKVLRSRAVRERGAATGASRLVEPLVPRARGGLRTPTAAASLVKYLVLVTQSRPCRTFTLAGVCVECLGTGTLLLAGFTLALARGLVEDFVP